jgi:hypothetical protein
MGEIIKTGVGEGGNAGDFPDGLASFLEGINYDGVLSGEKERAFLQMYVLAEAWLGSPCVPRESQTKLKEVLLQRARHCIDIARQKEGDEFAKGQSEWEFHIIGGCFVGKGEVGQEGLLEWYDLYTGRNQN